MRHAKVATGKKIVLHIDDEQRVANIRFQLIHDVTLSRRLTAADSLTASGHQAASWRAGRLQLPEEWWHATELVSVPAIMNQDVAVSNAQ